MRVAYVGPVALPEGAAAARRMLGIAQSIRAAGHEVIFGSGQMPRPGRPDPIDFEGFPVFSLGERPGVLMAGQVLAGLGTSVAFVGGLAATRRELRDPELGVERPSRVAAR